VAASLRDLLRGRLEISVPVYESDFENLLGLPSTSLAAAFAGLESDGFAFRGAFLPELPGTQWCERRLLFRMRQRSVWHRRRQVVTVPASRYQEFLFRWQGLIRPVGLDGGPDSLLPVLESLEGYEAPAELWEKEILPSRIPDYGPAWLDQACHSGRFGFARFSNRGGDIEASSSPFLSLRHLPLAFYLRPNLRIWKRLAAATPPALTGAAAALEEVLRSQGASFADELFAAARVLPEEGERGLRILIHAGIATCDNVAGLRALMRPARKARNRPRAVPVLHRHTADTPGCCGP
jgi:ATP-dependent Lhr-like helicase